MIGIAILNAVANKKISFAEILVVNSTIVAMVWILEAGPFIVHESSQKVVYDNLDLLREKDKGPLFTDLSGRTGLAARRVSINQIDLLRHTASITVFYKRDC